MRDQRNNQLFWRSAVAFCLLLGLAILPAMAPSSARAEEFYRFKRMWPTLQQPWYFDWLSAIAVDMRGNVYVAGQATSLTTKIQKFSSDGKFIIKWGSSGNGDGEFWHPQGIAVDGSGNVYVADTFNHRIQKLSSNGEFITKWGSGSFGSGDGLVLDPHGIAVDGTGNVYVADTYNHRIQKFSSDGTFITKWGSGSFGSGDGEFSLPEGIAVDGSGNVYVADTGNNRIQKFSSDGTFITKWGPLGSGDVLFDSPMGIALDGSGNVYVLERGNNRIQKFSSDGTFITKWGSSGNGDGEFFLPEGIAVDGSGNVYVAEYGNNRIQKFSSDGTFITKWGSSGSGDGEFIRPNGIAVDGSGNVYVADTSNSRIQKFSSDGTFITKWGSYGDRDGEFRSPIGIAVDGSGNVYVADYYNSRIQKFSSDGTFIRFGSGDGSCYIYQGIAVDGSGNVYVACWGNYSILKFSADGTVITTWGSSGNDDGEFEDPHGIAADGSGNVYVADTQNHRIQKFSSDGTFITKWGSFGSGDGEFINPQGIAVDSSGNVYVADTYNHRIQKFSSDGVFIGRWGGLGSDPGQFYEPRGLSIGFDGRIYVADTLYHRIQVFEQVEVSGNNRAIVVAGGGPYDGNQLWPATEACANFAYRTLTYQGFSKERLRYLSSDTGLDLNNNGIADDVAGTPTRGNLEHAITEWAAGADDVVIYLTDHGGKGTFRLSDREILSSTDLCRWLESLEKSIRGRLIVVYDACESGSFLSALASSSGKRIVITSTSPGEEAYFVNSGSVSFSNFFWTHIFNGLDLFNAFSLANKAMRFTTGNQHPLLDADGNGKGNQAADYQMVRRLFIGNGTSSFNEGPAIASVSPAQVISGTGTALIYAEGVTDPDGAARVWATIRPPNFTPPASGNPVSVLPTLDLTWKEANRYEGTYAGFTISGAYRLALYAMDRSGNISAPKLTTVTVDSPLTRKAIIVAGGSPEDALWLAIEKNVSMTYEALLYQGYTDDTITFMSPVGIRGVDQLATFDNLEHAVMSWAGQSTQDLVLYLVGNGGAGTFRINAQETLSADDLKGWLDALQAGITGKVTVVYDAPQSGSFLPALAPTKGRERILIASTGANGRACFAAGGEVAFSRFFWNGVAKGANVREAFLQAKKSIGFACPKQTAGLDDNGNGKVNEPLDGILARQVTIGSGIVVAGDPPVIGKVSPLQTLNGSSSATIWAKNVTTTGTLSKVWAVITPPGYGAAGSGAITDLPALVLTRKGAGHYAAAYGGFSTPGTYRITVYASDKKGNTSLPKTTRVRRVSSPILK